MDDSLVRCSPILGLALASVHGAHMDLDPGRAARGPGRGALATSGANPGGRPSHSFAQLAEAIDQAFARWDRAHLCQFTLADGTVVTDAETAEDALAAEFGVAPKRPLLLEQAKVGRTVALGEEFRYVFDFGDDWTYACAVEEPKVDPLEVVGVVPAVPTVVWGWGTIPDQYGRLWDGDDGETPVPRRPPGRHPMLDFGWPTHGSAQPVDLRELRGATYRRDVAGILTAIEGREIDDLLQHVGAALQVILAVDRPRGEPLAVSVVNRLRMRGQVGDDVLAEDLLAELHDAPVAARRLPVDLGELGIALAGDPMEPGGYLDLHTGEVIPETLTDAAYVGDDEAIDIDADPERWLRIDRSDPREQWQDMADFASGLPGRESRRRLESATEGRGAFRRFKNAVHEEGLAARWYAFSEERQLGRARVYLADAGIRVAPPR